MFDAPAMIVCHHSSVPSSLISSFHFLDVLVEAFTLFVANIATVSRKPIEMVMQEVHFDTRVSSQTLICIWHVLYDIFKVGGSAITEEVLYNSNETPPCISFKWIHWKYKFSSCISFRMSGPSKIPALSFSILSPGNDLAVCIWSIHHLCQELSLIAW